jgi:hypothetical protein
MKHARELLRGTVSNLKHDFVWRGGRWSAKTTPAIAHSLLGVPIFGSCIGIRRLSRHEPFG